MPTNQTSTSDQPPQGINRRRVILGLIGLPVFIALFMFLPAGTWAWPKGWLVHPHSAGRHFSSISCSSACESRSHRRQKSLPRRNKRLGQDSAQLYFPAMAAVLLVAALDDSRFHWFPVPWWVCGVGYALLLAGIGIVTWAEGVNKFFEVTVRIQTERGHSVIDTGPYAIARHPGYVGGILHAIGMALSLGSLWALIPAGIASIVLIVRTQWEDQTLQEELNGYKEYAMRVRYKLIPGVW